MARRFAPITLMLLAFAVALPGLGGLRGMVLCVASEGHVAVEPTHAVPSCATECDDAPPSPDAHAVASDDHSCLDIPLGAFDLTVERTRCAPVPVDATGDTPTAHGFVAAAPFVRATAPIGPRDTRPPPQLARVRTVILRV